MSTTEFTEIATELVESVLHETIKALAKFDDDQNKITSISKIISNNVCGIVFRVCYETNCETSDSTSSLILKLSPRNVTRRTLMLSREIFLREIFIHDEVLYKSITFNSK